MPAFLEPDKRCYLHVNYGEQALSEICRSYPRGEQWQGAYLLRGLYTSCPDVQALLQRPFQLHYELVRPGSEALRRYARRVHPLGREAGLLWLGLQLDLITLSPLTPVQNLRCLARALRPYAAGPLSALDAAAVRQLHAQLQLGMQKPAREGLFEALNDATVLSQAQTWLLGLLRPLEQLQDTGAVGAYVSACRAGALPVLSRTERELLNRFLGAYLPYRLLALRCLDQHDRPFFWPAYFLLAAHVCLIQWLALYERSRTGGSLEPEQLQRAATLIGSRFEQSPELFDNFAVLRPRDCLDGIEGLLSEDFGAEPPAVL